MELPIPRCYLNRTQYLPDQLVIDAKEGFAPLSVDIAGGCRGILMFSTPEAAQRYTEQAGIEDPLSIVFCSHDQLRELLAEYGECGPTMVIVDRNPGQNTYYAAKVEDLIAALGEGHGEEIAKFELFTSDGIRLTPDNRPT